MTSQEYQEDIERLRPRLLQAALRYLGDAEEAEDVAQDVMLKLWSMCEELRPPIDKLALVMVKNLCIDRIRSRRPRVNLDQVSTVEEEKDERLEAMMQAIKALPPLQQTILLLRHEQGMETHDIALLMGMTEVAVRKTLSRARMTVRDKLTKRK
ncbi:MAG: sigma-70 family RNA polymerase sigma factor [Prevotella sp.]|nr:sigma-70 family RNA polymerase sigma factor [Prevotella sp.]